MTPRQIELFQESWNRVEPIAYTVARLFYLRLFELAPEARSVFKTSMSEQEDHLIESLTLLAERLDGCQPVVEGQSMRQAGYQPAGDYGKHIGQALTWALEQGLGQSFDKRVRDAWNEVYATYTEFIVAAALDAESAASDELQLVSV